MNYQKKWSDGFIPCKQQYERHAGRQILKAGLRIFCALAAALLAVVIGLVLGGGLKQHSRFDIPAKVFAQEISNTVHVAQMPGPDVGTKMTNAQNQCSVNTAIPCVIVIDSILAGWPQGSRPGRCAQCIWMDYSTTTLTITPLAFAGGTVLAADGTAVAPGIGFASETNSGLYRSGSGTVSISILGTHVIAMNTTNFQTGSGKQFCWSSSTSADGASCDTGLSRPAAGTVAVGNGTAGDFSGTLKVANITGNPAITQPSIVTGISQGSGAKHQRFGATCTTPASVGGVCNTTYSWTAAFADANYTVVCVGDGRGGATAGVPIVNNVNTISGASFNVSIGALTAVAASYPTVDCMAWHD